MTRPIKDVPIDEYELKAWIERLGSAPVLRVAHEDRSESYEMDAAHVFELESGKFALVTESGCSCYEPSSADIELFPDQAEALVAFAKWQKKG